MKNKLEEKLHVGHGKRIIARGRKEKTWLLQFTFNSMLNTEQTLQQRNLGKINLCTSNRILTYPIKCYSTE